MPTPLERLAGRSGSAYAFFALAAAADALLFFDRGAALSALALALLAASLAMLVVERRRTFLYLLAAQYLLAAAVVVTAAGALCPSLLACWLAVMPAVVYERYPTNLALSGGYVAGTSAFLLLAVGWRDASLYALSGALLSISGSLLGRYREAMVDLQRRASRLEDNVASLTGAVSMSQDYARDAEEKSRLAERSRLARDIHDTVGYTLTNNIMMMEAVKILADTEPGRIAEYVERIRGNTEKGLAEIRKILRDLSGFDELEETLYFALKRLVRVFSSSTGVDVGFELGNADWSVLEAHRDAVYHFVQEGLVNAFRHGRAERVTLFLWDDGESARITLEDNGQGPPDGAVEGIGIAGMRERFGRIRGRVEVEPAAAGFRISAYLPSRMTEDS